MTVLLICTAHVLGLAIGFAFGWSARRPAIERAELRGLTNRHVLTLSPEEAARRVP